MANIYPMTSASFHVWVEGNSAADGLNGGEVVGEFLSREEAEYFAHYAAKMQCFENCRLVVAENSQLQSKC